MSAINHLVMWKLNGATPAERRAQAARMVQAFETARSQVPGAALHVEPSPAHAGTEQVAGRAFDLDAAARHAPADAVAARQVAFEGVEGRH